MKKLLMAVSIIALGLTVIPAFMVWQGGLEWDTHAQLMLLGTILWFATAPFWMGKSPDQPPA